MIGLVAALVVAASCDQPGLGTLAPAAQEQVCGLLAQTPDQPPAVDRAGLAAIYERPEFATARTRDTGALRAVLAQVRGWLEALFESSGAETYSNITRFFVLVLGCLLAAGAVLRLLGRRRARRGPQAAPPLPAALQLERPAVHLSRARALLTTDPREAIREGLLGLLSHLEEQRLARPDRVKTNRELTEELPARGAPPELVRGVASALAWYDRAFYSLEPVARDEAARFLEEVSRLGAAAAGGTAGAAA